MTTRPVCVVTGVGPGTGLAVARRFAAGGYAVAMMARSAEALAGFARETPEAHSVPADVADPASVDAAFARVRETLGAPTVLVHNAGNAVFGSVLDTTIFFTVAFAPALAGIDALFGLEDGSLGFPAPWLGVGPEVPLWFSLACGDFMVKFLAALLLLAPYRVLMGKLKPLPPIGALA